MKRVFGIGLLGLSLSTPINAENYPAAYFQPKILYSAENNDSPETQAKPSKIEDAGDFDPRYPAAHFQPKVIYINDNPNSNAR